MTHLRVRPASLGHVASLLVVAFVMGTASGPVWAQEGSTPAISETVGSQAELLRSALEFYRTQQYSEAARLFARYVALHPDEWSARKFLGLCYLKLYQPDRALKELNAVAAALSQDVTVQQAIRQAREILREQREREERKPKPEEIQKWVVQAETLIRQKKISQAEALLLQVLEEVPHHELALRRQAEIYTGSGRFLDAANLYGRLLRQGGPQQKEVELRRARCLAWAKRYAEAIPHFDSYLKAVPEDSAARFDLAEVHRWSGEPEDASVEYQRILEREPAHVAARMGLARSYDELGRYAEALQEFEVVLRADPDNEEARQGRARCFEATLREKKRLASVAQERKDYAEAIRLLNEYAQTWPEEAETLRQLGRLYSWAGEQGRARDHYEQYLRRNPDDRIARLELAEIQSWQGDYSAARESFLSVLRAEPENVRALTGIIHCHQWSGAPDGVEPYLNQLQRMDPGNDLVPKVRGELEGLRQQRMRARCEQLEQAKDYQASIAAYREYLAAFGPDPQMELRIPRLYAWNRQYGESIEEYQSYLIRYPQSESARLELADVQRWKADYESALQNYSSYLAEHPRHPRGLLGKAEALYATRTDLFEVQKAFQQASRADPGNPLIVDRLREIAAKLRPLAQLQTAGIFDSDGLKRVIFEPRATFLLPAGYRLTSLLHTSYIHQDRFLRGTDPVVTAFNQHLAEQDGTIWGARTGLRLERRRGWGGWGVEAQIGSFSDDRISLAVAADLTKHVGEGGLFWTRYAHDEASFELNTLASLAAGIVGNTWRVQYTQKLPHGFYLSPGFAITHLSGSERFGFRDNWRHAADVRLSYRRFRRFQPGYSYSASSYRKVSPLYFSPELYQAHRFEYLAELGRRERLQFLVNGSLGLGRIDGTNTFEFTLAPQVTLRLPQGAESELLYQFGHSQASSFGRANYTVQGFRFIVRFPIPGVRR